MYTGRVRTHPLIGEKAMADKQPHTTEIVRAMGEIAARAGKLARDAADQAAQAGNAGRGFAGVAEEAQELAERCAEEATRLGAVLEGAVLAKADLKGVGAAGTTKDDSGSPRSKRNLARLIVHFSIGLSAPAAAVLWLLVALDVVHWSLWLAPAFGASGLLLANLIELAGMHRRSPNG
jgi:hypothetical protein